MSRITVSSCPPPPHSHLPPLPPKIYSPPPSSTQESTATFAPVVQLEEVDVKSGEEDEEIIFSIKAKVRHWLSRHL